jgi:FkbM family methyltransferase
MIASKDPLASLLRPERLTAVVDVGANPIDGSPPYANMLARKLCTLVGFEPQAAALSRLIASKSDNETYLPYAVGDGSRAKLKVCLAEGMTSLFTPDPRALSMFPHFSEWGRVVGEFDMDTRRLDDITEIRDLDYLKIDIQGGELAVFLSGKERLAKAVAIQTEVSFMALYEGQPVYGDIDLALRGMGFIPHMFAAINKRVILPLQDPANPHFAMNQLLEADVVYVRDFTRPESMSVEQLKHLAMVAHHCYASFDLAMNCVHQLQQRGDLGADAASRYLAIAQGRAA